MLDIVVFSNQDGRVLVMDQRIERVLEHVVADYIRTAEPVSSGAVVASHKIPMSSATVRNWFATLEDEGYLIQPHTSAGRVPSTKAYEWYVARLGAAVPSDAEQKLVIAAMADGEDADGNAKRIAKASAEYVGTAILVGTNESDAYYTGLTSLFSQPEFSDWARVVSMGSVLDRLDRELAALRSKTYTEPTALIGGSCPFGNGCATVVLTLSRKTIIAAFGPMRMDYRKARNVLAAANAVLNQ
jgi:transcriptional regulator of heat shock response